MAVGENCAHAPCSQIEVQPGRAISDCNQSAENSNEIQAAKLIRLAAGTRVYNRGVRTRMSIPQGRRARWADMLEKPKMPGPDAHCWLVQQCGEHGWTSQPWHPTTYLCQATSGRGDHFARPCLRGCRHDQRPGFPGQPGPRSHRGLPSRSMFSGRTTLWRRGHQPQSGAAGRHID